MRKIGIFSAFILFVGFTFSQTSPEVENWCGTAFKMNEMRSNPQINQSLLNDEQIRIQEVSNPLNTPKGTIFKIPIVFHILHNGGSENVEESQIWNALEVINRDFALQNDDTSSILAQFKPLLRDAEIEFVLATKAPDGSCFKGYTRTQSAMTNEGDDGNGQVNAIRNGNDVYQGNWPSNMYLNIFVVNDAGGAGGYTHYPNNWGGTDMSNGIWILNQQFGEIGTSSMSAGRSLTHECGHWLNLKHTWGDSNSPGDPGNCSMDDDVSDTPLCQGSSGGCNLAENGCGPVANIQNYMDYALSCQSMFTDGQVNRMRTAIQSSVGGRNNLWTPSNLAATGAGEAATLCKAEFSADRVTICLGDQITFSDESYSNVTGRTWTFTGGTPSTSNLENPTVTYSTPGLYAVSLTATDGSSNVTETKTQYIRVLDASSNIPLLEGFENFTTLVGNMSWETTNANNDEAFEITNSAGHTGSKSVKLANYGESSGSIDELISSTYDLSNESQVTLSFRYAYKKISSNSDDWLRIYISKDCGENWAIRKTMHGSILGSNLQSSPYTPSQSDWVTVHITNITSSYLVDNFKLKFGFEAGGGNNFYLDNINLYAGGPNESLTSVGELENIYTINAFPNPTDNSLSVQFESLVSESVQIELIDISGKIQQQATIVSQAGTNLVMLDVASLQAGIYFLNVETSTGSKRIKIKVN